MTDEVKDTGLTAEEEAAKAGAAAAEEGTGEDDPSATSSAGAVEEELVEKVDTSADDVQKADISAEIQAAREEGAAAARAEAQDALDNAYVENDRLKAELELAKAVSDEPEDAALQATTTVLTLVNGSGRLGQPVRFASDNAYIDEVYLSHAAWDEFDKPQTITAQVVVGNVV